MNVRAFAWAPGAGDEAWQAWEASLPEGTRVEDFVVAIDGDRSGNALSRKLRYWKTVQRVIGAEAKPGDVVWARDFSTALFAMPSLFGVLPGRRGLKCIYDASSLIELEVGLRDGDRLHGIKGWAERIVRRDFHLVRTLGEGMREYLLGTGLDEDRVFVAPVGADRPSSVLSREPKLQRLLYVGSASKWQGMSVLLDAMRTLEKSRAPVRLSIVGAKLEDVPEAASLSNVDFLGWVDRAGMPQLYADHDLFLIPRPRMALTEIVIPMKCVEAQAHGIPILGSDLGAIREITGGESAVLVAPDSPTAIVDAIEDLLENPQRLTDLHTHAVRRSEQFSWDAIGRKIAERIAGDMR